MPAPKPANQVVIRPGMSEAIDARHLPIGTPRLLQNVRVRQGARFEHRPALADAENSGLATTGNGVWVAEQAGAAVACAHDTLIGSLTAPNVYRLNPAGTWSRLGRHGMNVPERRFGMAIDQTDRGRSHTCAVVNGSLYVAHTDRATGETVSIYRIDPSGLVLATMELADAANPRLVYAGGVLYIVTREPSGAGTDIEIRTVNVSSLAFGSATTLATLTGAGARFDAAPVEGGATWVIAFPDSANVMRIHVMSGAASSANATVATTDATVTGIGIAAYQGEQVCVAFYDNAVLRATVLDVATLLVGNTFDVRAAAGSETYAYQCGVVRSDASEFYVIGGGTDSDSSPTLDTSFIAVAEVSSSAVVTGPYKHWHYHASSKPWTVGADGAKRVYIWASNNGSPSSQFWDLQGRHFILDVSALYAFVDAVSYEHTPAWSTVTPLYQHIPEAPSFDSGRRATVLPWDDPGQTAGIDVAVWRAPLPSESMAGCWRQTIEVNGVLHVAGGNLTECVEGKQDTFIELPENGFPYAPEIAVELAGSSGSLTASQEYTYKSVYRWMDAQGRVHRSAPSEAKTVTTNSTNLAVRTRISTLEGSAKPKGMSAEPVAEVYRSWNGGPYYYVTSTTGIAAQTFSDVSITVSDSSSDSGLSAQPVLYTDLGILPTEPPSGARLVCASGERMFTVGWRPNVVQFSKLYIPTAPWEFVDDDGFRIFYPEELTALAYMDGTLVAFSERSIFLVTGEGPNDQGVGEYSTPRKLTCTAGSEGPHVVEVPAGLMYKSAGTIWLLPRGFGAPVPVGDDVQVTLGQFPYLRSAVRCANSDDDCTHFVLASNDGTSADTCVLVWDNKLSSWISKDTIANIGAAGAVGGVYYDVRQAWTGSTGVVRYLTGSQSGDGASANPTHIGMRLAFGDWRPWGPLGWGRLSSVMIHGESPSNGTNRLNLVTVVDGVTGTHQLTVANGGEFYAEHALKNAQGSAFRFEIYDSVTGAATKGLVIHSLAYSASEGDGLRRLSNSERF